MDNDCTNYGVYSFDLGAKQVDNKTLLKLAGVEEAAFLAQAKQRAEQVFRAKYEWAQEDALFADRLAYTIDDAQINLEMRMYLDDTGALLLISDVGSLVGANMYTEVYPFEMP